MVGYKDLTTQRLIVPFMARYRWHQEQRIDRMKKGMIAYTEKLIEINEADEADRIAKDTHARRQREYERRKKK